MVRLACPICAVDENVNLFVLGKSADEKGAWSGWELISCLQILSVVIQRLVSTRIYAIGNDSRWNVPAPFQKAVPMSLRGKDYMIEAIKQPR